MAFYRNEKNYVVNGGSYTFGVHKFTRVEQNSHRNVTNNNLGGYLHTCYSGNKICEEGGAIEPIIPIYHPCSVLSSKVKMRKCLMGKTQLDAGVSNKYKCEYAVATAEEQSTNKSTSSSTTKRQSRTVPSNRKYSQTMVLEEQAVEGEKKISILEEEISQLKNGKKALKSKLKKQEEISECYKQDLRNMYRDFDSPLSTALTNLLISRYTKYDAKNDKRFFKSCF